MKPNRIALTPGCALLAAAGGLALPLSAADQMPSSPVSAYTFDEGSGTVVADPFGGIIGSLQGAAAFSTMVPLTYAGNFSLDLSAADNDYVDLGDQASLFFPDSFSISLWVQATEASGNTFGNYIVSDYASSADLSSFSFRLQGTNQGANNGRIGFFWENPQQGFFVAEGTTDVDDALNIWFHVVGVWDGTTRMVYVDGVLEGVEATEQFRDDVGGNTAIGRAGSFENQSFNFNGLVDEVAFFDYALNGDEVSWLRNNSIRSLPVPPVAAFAIVSFSYVAASNAANLTWTSTPAASYLVERTLDLQSGSWAALPGNVPSGGATTSFTDSTIPAGTSRVFYRVRTAN